MRMQFGDYEIEIKARFTGCGSNNVKFNKFDTMSVLNKISLFAGEASENLRHTMGENALSDEYEAIHKSLYRQLENKGLYRNC